MSDGTSPRPARPANPVRSPEYDRDFGPLRARVTGYLCRLTGGDRAAAEDLAQETLLAAYRQQGDFRAGANPLAYLMGIARRRWRDGNRGKAAEARGADDTATDAAEPDATPEWIDRLTLRAALDRLPEAERRALEVTAVEGHTYAEAARILGEPAGTLKWRVHEATRKLRVLLAEGEESEP
jgi:RNA polymerase sigma-70 factor, ECF subfamily